jgi:hypothetical protein
MVDGARSASRDWRTAPAAMTVFAWLIPTLALAATPTDELLKLLPADAGLCLVVRDLHTNSERLIQSPLFAHFKASPFGQSLLLAPEVRRLEKFDKDLQDHLHISLKQIHEEVLGNGVVFAYWPAPADQSRNDYGLFLIRARTQNPKLLTNLIQRINELQQRSKELVKVESLAHQGEEYHVRLEKNGNRTYYFIHGDLAAFSSHQPLIHQVIDGWKRPPDSNPIAQRFRELGVADAFVTWWLNPRVFDAHLQHRVSTAQEPDATFLRTFARYWQQLEGVALALRVEKDLELDLSVRMNVAGLPESAQRLLATASERSRVWDYIPERTLFAAGGRLDLVALKHLVSEFFPPALQPKGGTGWEQLRQAFLLLGHDLEKDILPNLGPDWGFYVVAPPAHAERWFPYSVFAVAVAAKPDEKPLNQTLVDLLQTALKGLARFAPLEEKFEVRVHMEEMMKVVVLDSEKLAKVGLAPSFAAHSTFLILGSSPEAINTFSRRRDQAPMPVPPSVLLARLSLSETRAYLKTHRQALLRDVFIQDGILPAEAEKRFDLLLSLLGIFERVELVQTTAQGRANLILRFHAPAALPQR